MRLHLIFRQLLRVLPCSCLFAFIILSFSRAQQAPQEPAEKKPEKAAQPEKSENPYQIELLETRYRFESNGDSRKEVHTRVHINNELGVRQFARLNFDYNRSFESIEIPLVHVTHPSGGTADILPSAITDNPNPAVVNAPAYQDVRVKSVRILGLEPGDVLEYRIITTTTHHPFAPDFWLDHSFDRSGAVSEEVFEVNVPVPRKSEIRFNQEFKHNVSESESGDRVAYLWRFPKASARVQTSADSKGSSDSEPDVLLSTTNWLGLSLRLDENLTPGSKRLEGTGTFEESPKELPRRSEDVAPEIAAKTGELTKGSSSTRASEENLYDFVSQKIATVELPLGSTGFVARPAKEILASGYATQEDKFVLLAALAAAAKISTVAALTGYCGEKSIARPTVFKHLIVHFGPANGRQPWLDPALEVAPFAVIPPNSGKCVFILNRGFSSLSSTGHEWEKLETEPPFPSRQRVSINAVLGSDGTLKSKVHYSMRGDNELLLRVAFHQSPKEKWRDLAQLLSLSDGFRGQVTSVTASDPYATKEPFTIDYEITQPKFVDWSKKPVHIPALLPQLGLPDPPAKPVPGAPASPVDLGTPLEVETRMTLRVPPGTAIAPPTGTSVQRDYATFASQYSVKGPVVTASRHINFLLRQVSAARAADYNAFLNAVQSDQAQLFTIERTESAPAKSSPAATPRTAAPATPPPTPKP